MLVRSTPVSLIGAEINSLNHHGHLSFQVDMNILDKSLKNLDVNLKALMTVMISRVLITASICYLTVR